MSYDVDRNGAMVLNPQGQASMVLASALIAAEMLGGSVLIDMRPSRIGCRRDECTNCGQQIPPGRAGRKCSACRSE